MPYVDTEALAAHAQHVHLLADNVETAKDHAESSATSTQIAGGVLGFWLGIPGSVIGAPMGNRVSGFNTVMERVAAKSDDAGDLIEETAERWDFVEQANVELAQSNTTELDQVDNFHQPESIGDFPDAGRVNSIGTLAETWPAYREAGEFATILGTAATGLDLLGFYLNPVSGIAGEFAGLIINLAWPLKELLDVTLGDPGAITEAAAVYEQMGTYLADAAQTYHGSLASVTAEIWDEPAREDYLQVAEALVNHVVAGGAEAVEMSGDLLRSGALCTDTRAAVFDLAVWWVLRSVVTAAAASAAAVPTAGASIPAATTMIQVDSWMTLGQAVARVAAAGFRFGAAAMVANSKAAAYADLTADLA